LSTATDLRTINSGNTQVDLLLFSPDGKFLASSSGRFVKLWDLASGKVLRSWGAQKLVVSLAFSPDSKALATGEADPKYLTQGAGKLFGGGEVELWDVADGTQHRSLGQRTNPVWGVAFSPDGKTLATGESNVGLLLPPGWFLKGISVKDLYSYVLWFGDVRDYGMKNLNSLVLWDVTSGTEIRTLGEHPEPINNLLFSPDGKTLLSSSMDGTINLWGMPEGKELRTLQLTAWYTSRNRSVALAPDGKVLATLSSNGSVTLLDMANGQELRSFSGNTVAILAIGFSPDSKMLATGFGDGTVKVWEVDTGRELPISFGGHKRAVINVAFLPDGKTLLSEDNYGELKFWDTASGNQTRTLAVGGSAFAFSSDGKMLAEGQEKINLRDIASGNGLCPLMMSANSLAFSPDNKLLASASNKVIALWDVIHVTESCGKDKAEWWGEGEFTPLLKLSGHTDDVSQVAFSPDGKLLISASNDKTIKLWDVASGKELKTINSGAAYYVAFSPDGKFIVSASSDGTIRLWGVAP
jgi:WD40 repeat protein